MKDKRYIISSLCRNSKVEDTIEWVGYTLDGSSVSILLYDKTLSVMIGSKGTPLKTIEDNGDEIISEEDVDFNFETITLADIVPYIEEYIFLDPNICLTGDSDE